MDASWFTDLHLPHISLVPGGLNLVQYDPTSATRAEKPLFSDRKTTTLNFEALEQEIMKVMEFRYAPSTWVQRRSILKSYLHFCHDNHLAVTHDSMTQFIIWKKSKVSTGQRYST
eukprot:gene11160-biopygen5885